MMEYLYVVMLASCMGFIFKFILESILCIMDYYIGRT